MDDNIKYRAENNTHLKDIQDFHDNINNDNPSKDKLMII